VAPIGFQLCNNYAGTGQYREIADVASKAIALIESTGRQSDSFGWGFNVHAALYGIYGIAVAELGDIRQGEALCEKGLRLAQGIKDLYSIAWAEVMYGTLHCVKGDGGKAIAHLENGIKHCEETQFMTLLGLARQYLGWGYFLVGELGTAREQVEKGEAHNRAVGLSIVSSLYYWQMADICLEAGDWERARNYAEEGLQRAKSHGERDFEGSLSVCLGTALAKTEPSQSARAEELILQGIKIHGDLKLTVYCAHGYLNLGVLYADTGQKVKARRALKKARTMYREMGMDYYLARTEKALERLKG
jgi:tetratricopeptide (TPR) repeat protein